MIDGEKDVSEEIQADTGAEPADISLDDAISKALEDPDAPADTDPTPSDDRTRDERGRFAAKDRIETDTPPLDDQAAAPAPVESTEQKPAEPAPNAEAKATDGHFRGWSPEQRAKFETLPKEAQEVALALKKETDAHYTGKLMEAAEFRRTAEPVLKTLSQHADVFAAAGMAPVEAVSAYANLERTLSFGTFEQKLGVIGQICERYNIPFAPQQALQAMDPTQVQTFAALHDRDAEVARLKAENATTQRDLQSYQSSQLAAQIEAFQTATLPDGSPKHPHFEAVKLAMGSLLSSGKAKTLDEAYAIAAKPIDEAIAAQTAAVKRAQEEANRQAVDRAKKAQPVKSSPAAPNGRTVATKGLDAVIAGALDATGF